jgi:hypothetical protein
LWNVTFADIRNNKGEQQPGRLFWNLMLPTQDAPPDDFKPGEQGRDDKWTKYQDRCYGQLHGFFEALGFTTDSDTDEMLGERCLVVVGVETIQQGPRTGLQTNRVNGIEPIPDGSSFADSDDNDPEF